MPNRFDKVSTVEKTLVPWSVATLMSEGHLHGHGLRILKHDARYWLVSVDADILTSERPSAAWLPVVIDRTIELSALASEENMPFAQESATRAIDFARELNAARRPGVFLVGNGNVRLLWSEGVEQIGLQFKADGTIQYVMFARRGERVATNMGDDDQPGILRQITAAGLRHLLND